MANKNVSRDIDLLRRDECKPLTTEQMADIKSQFHPSSTANVNIVPYEIYDEDGEEQIAGEVRKTIDGVKKKKPVYRKYFSFKSSTSTGTWQRKSIGASVDVAIKQNFYIIRKNNYSAYAANGAAAVGDLSVKVAVVIGNEHSDNAQEKNTISIISNNSEFLGATIYGTLEYTKTTDSWEEV